MIVVCIPAMDNRPINILTALAKYANLSKETIIANINDVLVIAMPGCSVNDILAHYKREHSEDNDSAKRQFLARKMTDCLDQIERTALDKISFLSYGDIKYLEK